MRNEKPDKRAGGDACLLIRFFASTLRREGLLPDRRTGEMTAAPVGSINFKATLQYFGIEW